MIVAVIAIIVTIVAAAIVVGNSGTSTNDSTLTSSNKSDKARNSNHINRRSNAHFPRPCMDYARTRGVGNNVHFSILSVSSPVTSSLVLSPLR